MSPLEKQVSLRSIHAFPLLRMYQTHHHNITQFAKLLPPPPPPTVPSPVRSLTVTRVFQGGIELNWLPPTEPNGEVHYVVEYKREDSGNWTSVNTTSDSTHYNLTGLNSGTNYTIRVVAVNSVGRSTITRSISTTAAHEVVGVVVGVVVVFLLIMIVLTTSAAFIVRRVQRRKRKVSHKVEEETKAPTNTSREEQEETHAVLHCEVMKTEPNSKSGDVTQPLREGSFGEAAVMNFTGEYYNIFEDQSVLEFGSKDSQQTGKPTGIPNVVYAVIDKSKKQKPVMTIIGQRTTTDHYLEDQYYAHCSPIGEGMNHPGSGGDVGQGSLSKDAKETGPQSEPCNPGAVYAVVDKSKKRNRGKATVPVQVDKTQMEIISIDECEPLMQQTDGKWSSERLRAPYNGRGTHTDPTIHGIQPGTQHQF